MSGAPVALCLASAAKLLLAIQAAQATVAGTVRDADSGHPIEHALVALTDLDRAVSTGADGRYRLADVPPGPHHITVRFIGYAQRTLHALVPREGQLEINVALEPSPARLPTIEVRPGIAVRGVEEWDTTVFADRSVSMAAAWNDPLLSEPDGFQALGGGEVVLDPESPSGVHIRGGASDQTGYLLDGIPVFSPYHAAGVFSAWNPDALAGLRLSSSGPSPDQPDALAGTISAETREPGATLRTQGSVSTTQARMTVDGPVGLAGSRFLLSVRSGSPYFLSKHEASYLRSEVGDWLATLEAPLLGGQVRALGYDNDNEINAAAVAGADTVPGAGTNRFEWRSRSLGAEWRRSFPRLSVRLRGWHATADAGSTWAGRDGRTLLAAERRDYGLVASAERRSGRGLTRAGLRLELSRTAYRVAGDSSPPAAWDMSARTPVATLFAQHTRALGRRTELRVGATLAAAAGSSYLGPRLQLGWRPSDRITILVSTARTHQFSQSLRNPESVVGNIFPADLFIGAGAPGVPVARSDQQAVAAEYRPASGVRLGVQAYRRDFDDVLLVAPGETGPFTTGSFAVGGGRSLGLSLEAAMSAARWGLVASYGWEHVRLDPGASEYVPTHGASHVAEGGVTFFPTATTSIRLGAAGALGRRATSVAGGFEWESCNLLDQGCEFGGSPTTDGALGGARLPAYARVDLGVRKHWHFTLGGRDAVVALFGTLTNVLNRKNVLTYARTPDGALVPIEMRPLAPLVVGLDWHF
jgi:hypothetical protein